MSARRVKGDGVELAVFERGDPRAPTVVLVHGYPDTHAVWDGVAEALAARYHVVAYDVRGAGASGAPASREGYRLEHLARDLAAVIDATAPGKRVHVVGHDWGSIQAWEAVTDPAHAARVASFTSISGPCLDHVGHWVRENAASLSLDRLASQALRSWYIYAFQVPGVAERVWRNPAIARAWPGFLARVEGAPADAGAFATLGDDAARGVELYRANVPSRLASPRARRTDVPVQVIAPRGDRYVSAALAGDVARWAPRLFVREVAGGHWIVRSAPARVARWAGELIEHAEGRGDAPELARARRGGDPAGRVVVVTGGASGIGRETAFAFARRSSGTRVVLADVDLEGAERTALLCRHLGAEAEVHRVDVGDAAAMERFARDVVRDHGAPDVLVNNAGIGVAGRFLATGVDDWRRALDVNLWGVIHGCRLFAQAMVDRGGGGHVVNVASAAAFAPSVALPAYSTTKSAVLMLTECLRAELAPHAIGVSAICPGLIDTPITTSTRFVGATDAQQAARRATAARFYRRRGVGPEAVARAIVRAVDRDEPVVPVTLEAHAAHWLGRLAPGVARRLARLDPTASGGGA